ncbi:MAG: hypothetical protein A2381_07505 [Bdellovibrionales bacterium RIFOXYB1_FULL_37_110]|nr:MAG: hypothetical protein A2181_04270 [Bdellovibrionales bacterium RIFOXYA1_FULL_38_20]OFZ52453.1 MAG: hypothetical protein A2417_00225 [Bdellovibrionales bacterium RIFOXYC1_FULL_37_79]OFZ59655.1 MAG: hypothetical protein A2381_07505 [Bdellovibrionales bacterium RIFOXYB1_FULL_37_110]OFZ62582.1 MAG: hypothetical protein A2577_11825 [Bdellovibrionales bacterium RIFOXYD1_FULL_36_51]
MEKNWLIRTTKLKILGPASRDKIIELVEKGSLAFEDEICVGNGFWFSIKEKEFLKRYLFDQEVQNFNPISEAEVVFGGPDSPSINDCINFPVKGNVVADAAKKILTEHFDRKTSQDVTQLTNLADFFKVADVHKKLKHDQGPPNNIFKATPKTDENELTMEEEEELVIYPAGVDQEFPSIVSQSLGAAQDEILSTPSDGSGMILQLSPDKIRVEMKNNQKPMDGFEVDVGVLLANKKNGHSSNPEEQLAGQSIALDDEDKDEDSLFPSMDDLEFPSQENIEAVKRGEKLPTVAKEKVQEILIDLKKTKPVEKIIIKEEGIKPPVSPAKTVDKKVKKSVSKTVSKKKKGKPHKSRGGNRRNSTTSSSTSKLLVIVVTAIILLYCLFQFTDIIAKEIRPLEVGKKLLDFPPLINSEIVISSQMNPGGFRLEEFDGEIPSFDCQKINDFYYRLKILLYPGIDKWMRKNSMSKICPLAKSEFLALFDYRSKKMTSVGELEKYLKSFKIDELQIKKILEIYSAKKEILRQEEYVDSFINSVQHFVKAQEIETEKVVYFDKHLELMSQKYPDTIISSYFKMLTYWQVGNTYQVKRVMSDVVSTGFIQLVLKNPVSPFLDQNKMKGYVNSIVGLMRILEADFGNKIEYQMMLNYLSLTYDTLEFYELKKRNNCDWNISQIWEKSKSVNFGLTYFAFWGSLLLSFDQSLAHDYINQSLSVENLKKIDRNSLWFLAFFKVDDLKINQMMADRIAKELLTDQDEVDEQTVINFLQNQVVVKRLIREDSKYAKLSLELEIEFYKKLLSKGRSVEYAIYQLLRRNQIKNEYLWWWVL